LANGRLIPIFLVALSASVKVINVSPFVAAPEKVKPPLLLIVNDPTNVLLQLLSPRQN
jgi:hypothetical protein